MPEVLQASRATLGGVPLLASSPIAWELREGVVPVVREFPIQESHRNAFGFGRQKVELVIEAAGEQITVKELYVLDVQPGPQPQIVHVRVADRRYWWPYSHLIRRYNMRRKVGSFRPDSPNANLITPILSQVAYWPWSLRDGVNNPPGSKWKAREILSDILGDLTAAETEVAGAPANVVNRLPQAADNLPVEDLEIDESADQALNRILDYIPGSSVYVELDGTIVFFDTTNSREIPLVLPRVKIRDRGEIRLVEKQAVRPRAVNVLFTYESEFRFDFIERSKSGPGASTLPDFTDEDRERSRLLENVLAMPDFSLEVTSNAGANQVTEEIHQGTYIELEDALEAWGNADGDSSFPPAGGRAVKINDLLKGALPFVDLGAGLIPPNSPNADLHMARVGALLENYRRTFRIPERWMSRFLSLRAYRVATIDFATGTRAPAVAYCDYCYLRSQPIIVDGIGEAGASAAHYGRNVAGYPTEGEIVNESFGFREIDTKSNIVPARVSIADQDQGILQINYLTEAMKYYSLAIPGQIRLDSNPKVDIRRQSIAQDGDPLFFNASPSGGKLPELDEEWKLAVVLTAIPSSPNNRGQLHEIKIEADDPDLQGLLPQAAQAGRRAAHGPSIDVRVPASLETARVRWNDSHSALIMEDVFGFDEGIAPVAPEGSSIEELIVNSQIRVGNIHELRNDLRAIALAEAARVYSEYTDRLEGNAEMGILDSPSILDGHMESLEFSLAPNGEFTVAARMPGEAPRLSMFSFLDAGTRGLVMRLAQGAQAD